MIHRPQRKLLLTQVIIILRRAITQGEWTANLPSERQLCEQLQVCRTTLRAALAHLQRKGMIKSVPRQGHLICSGKNSKQVSDTPKVIGILSGVPVESMFGSGQLNYRNIERHLLANGFDSVEHVMACSNTAQIEHHLENLIRRQRAAAWLLMTMPWQAQLWFARHRIPALISGHRYAGVKLPAMSIDYRATCRHAAGALLRLGHKNIALLVPKGTFAGKLESEKGYREMLEQSSVNEIRPLIWQFDSDTDRMPSWLITKFASKPRPTALIVTRASYAIAVASCLLGMGLQLGRDVSLICRDDDEALACFTPPISRYVINHAKHTLRVVKALLQLAQAGTIRPQSQYLFPRFIKTGTIGSAPRV